MDKKTKEALREALGLAAADEGASAKTRSAARTAASLLDLPPASRRKEIDPNAPARYGEWWRGKTAAMERAEAAYAKARRIRRPHLDTRYWAAQPGVLHRVTLPEDMRIYAAPGGWRVKHGPQEVVPAPKYWRSGAYPAGTVDHGPIH